MGKEKKKKAIKFNPAEYDYMDDMPLAGWIWDFIRRSDYYKEFYPKYHNKMSMYSNNPNQKIKADIDIMYDDFFEKYSPLIPIYSPDHKWLDINYPIFSHGFPDKTKLSPLKVVNLDIGFGVDDQYTEHTMAKHPKINKERNNKFSPGYYMVYDHPLSEEEWENVKKELRGNTTVYIVEDYPPIGTPRKNVDSRGNTIVHQNYPLIKHPIDLLWEYQGQKHMIMALIDILSPKSLDDILKELKHHLHEWRKALKLPTTKDAKTSKKKKNLLIKSSKIWKSYLIIYDLVSEGLSYKEVSELLSQHDDFYSDERNIQRHYDAAVKMMSEDYEKYL